MSEGELKKRMEGELTQKSDKNIYYIRYGTVLHLLDDAADEFLGFVYDVDQQFVLDWFKKQFGNELNASMPQTVAGGCAGHIDLGKLQDIEKEPDLSKAKPAPFVGTIIKEE